MTRNVFGAVLVAALVVLAGCAGGAGPGADGGSPTGSAAPADGGPAGTSGTVSFYISDRPNAIEDFEHLNVTITKVGLHRVGDGDDGEATATPNATTTVTSTATATPTATDGGNASAEVMTPDDTTTTATPDPTETPESTETEASEDGDSDENDSEGEQSSWVEYDVNATVDLTRLVGDNATKLDVLEAPAGSYDKVFVYVSDIDATLDNGESVNVKLPSEKLHINKQFEVGDGSNVSFVFDIAVHEAGKSGKYILRPVVSQSGTDVNIEDVDENKNGEKGKDKGEKGKDKGDDKKGGEGKDGDDEQDGPDALEATLVGSVAAGDNATVKVTGEDGPVANATVEVDGEVVGETSADGTLTFQVPEDAKKLKVKIKKGDAEAELERNLKGNKGGKWLAALPAPLAGSY